MFGLEDKVLKPGEKIYKLRKILRCTQDDLAGKCMTRNLLSLIENGKVQLTEKTAQCIANNFNIYAQKHNIDIECITSAYLMESEEEQINNIANEHIRKLLMLKESNITINKFDEDLREIEEFFKTFHAAPELIIEFFSIVADEYIKFCRWETAYNYAMKGFDAALYFNNYNAIFKFMRKKSRLKTSMKQYNDAITLCDYSFDLAKKFKFEFNEDMQVIIYNAIRSMVHIKKYKESVLKINTVLGKYKFKKSLEHNFKILLGNCYYELKDYNQAEKIYMALYNTLSEEDDANTLQLVLRSIAWTKAAKKDIESAYYFFNLASNIIIKDKKWNIAENEYNKLWYNIELGNVDYVDKNYQSVISKGIEANDNEILDNTINKTFNLFFSRKEYNKLYVFLKYLKNNIINDMLWINGISNIYFKAHNIMYIDKYERSMEVFNDGLEIVEYDEQKKSAL